MNEKEVSEKLNDMSVNFEVVTYDEKVGLCLRSPNDSNSYIYFNEYYRNFFQSYSSVWEGDKSVECEEISLDELLSIVEEYKQVIFMFDGIWHYAHKVRHKMLLCKHYDKYFKDFVHRKVLVSSLKNSNNNMVLVIKPKK